MKKAIIVGASSGIGRSLAVLMVQDNYRIGITGRRTVLLEDLKTAKPDSYRIKTFDTTQTSTIAQHLEELTQELGGLDILVRSSGTGALNEMLDFEPEKRTIDTNVSGFTAIADWAFNYFLAQKYGQLAAISSVAGFRGNSHAPASAASKAFQINYLEGLRIKAKKTSLPIFITDIRPGFVNTRMAQGQNLFWMASTEQAATQIFNALRRKQKTAYITRRWLVIGWLLKHLPNRILEKM
jgi:short-subunit dehydrogenase